MGSRPSRGCTELSRSSPSFQQESQAEAGLLPVKPSESSSARKDSHIPLAVDSSQERIRTFTFNGSVADGDFTREAAESANASSAVGTRRLHTDRSRQRRPRSEAECAASASIANW